MPRPPVFKLPIDPSKIDRTPPPPVTTATILIKSKPATIAPRPRLPTVAPAPAPVVEEVLPAIDEAPVAVIEPAPVAAEPAPATPVPAEPAPAPAPAPVATEPSAELTELAERITEKLEENQIKISPNAYMPVNRKGFGNFIIETYRPYQLPPLPKKPNPNACADAAKGNKNDVKAFAYQEFIRDYIQRPSPYRGVLVYHGLGSGKTCTSIAGLEALWKAGQRPVYVMTPASLSPNYRDEITKCGPFVFRKQNYWTFLSVPNLKVKSPELDFLINVIGLPQNIIKVNKGGWVPDPAQINNPNFDSLSPENRRAITAQIIAHMDNRIRFIHYNGLTEQLVRDWACNTPTMFDGSTIIIEEVHNLIRTINNSNLDLNYKDEPRTMLDYLPGNCIGGRRYRISYLLYRMLCSAVGCKFIALSATPIINFPQEVAILSNVLAGDSRMVEVDISGLDKQTQLKTILDAHPEIDFSEVIPRPEKRAITIRVTPVPSGCRKVVDPATGRFRGFIRDEIGSAADTELYRERNVRNWFEGIKAYLTKNNVQISDKITYAALPRLPDTEDVFRDNFIDTDNLMVKESSKLILTARLSGLISYYKGGKEEFMAKVNKDEVVLLDMSKLQLQKYTKERKAELDRELKDKGKKEDKEIRVESLYGQVTKKFSSTFKIFSRAACNLVFPEDLTRPIPRNYRDLLADVGKEKITEVTDDEIQDSGKIFEEADEVAEKVELTSEDGAEMPTAEQEIADAKELAKSRATATTTTAKPGSYAESLIQAVAYLRSNADKYFSAENLKTISPKFQAILDRLSLSKGPALVYSNFKTLEGVGLFGVALETQQKYSKFDIVKTAGGDWSLAPETIEAGGGPDKLRYITYTGDEERDKRNILLAVFNGRWDRVPGALAAQVKDLTGVENNQRGQIVKVIMITQSGAEGISLSNVRQVHIMEPYWNYVRLDQVKGRAIRICSHMDLPPEDRNVDIFTYIMKFSEEQFKDRLVDETLKNFDDGKTTDQKIYELMKAKQKLSDSVLDVMKTSAVDCRLNATENGGYACYFFPLKGDDGTKAAEPFFHPMFQEDYRLFGSAVRAAAPSVASVAPEGAATTTTIKRTKTVKRRHCR